MLITAIVQRLLPAAFFNTFYAEATMNYHINTILIWDYFKEGSECPLCAIRSHIEKQFISSYLNEAVMEDACREEVNKYGFCKRHFVRLYEGDNKLGLALQTHTRMKHLLKRIDAIDNPKAAAKMADKLLGELESCAICRLMDANMERYVATVPKMYGKEGEFRKLFNGGKGFCLEHFSMLIKASRNAGGFEKEFLQILTKMQAENFERVYNDLGTFTDMFDYKNGGKPWGTAKGALERSINKVCGKIIEE